MSRLSTIALSTALLLPLLAATAEGVERGCSRTRNGLLVPPYTGSLMVDGVLHGDSPGTDQVSAEYINATIADLDIIHMWIGCLELQREGKTIGVRLLSVVTKDGAVAVMRSQLEDLVEAQEVYRMANGAYAEAVTDLDFLASHPSPPIEVLAIDGRWTAKMSIEQRGTVCKGSAVLHLDRSIPPEVRANCQAV